MVAPALSLNRKGERKRNTKERSTRKRKGVEGARETRRDKGILDTTVILATRRYLVGEDGQASKCPSPELERMGQVSRRPGAQRAQVNRRPRSRGGQAWKGTRADRKSVV